MKYPVMIGVALMVLLLLWAFLSDDGSARNYPLKLGKNIPFDYLEDPDGTLSVRQVADRASSDFSRSECYLYKGYTNSAYWIRVQLPEVSVAGDELLLEIFPPYLDHLTVYQRLSDSEGNWHVSSLGDTLPVSTREINHRFFVIPLIDSRQGLDLLIRIQTSSLLMMVGKIWDMSSFIAASARKNLYWGAFFGIALLTSLLAGALSVFTREHQLIALSLYGISYLFIASIQGYVSWLLLPEWPWLADHLTGFSYFLTMMLMLWLGRVLFHIKNHAPRFDLLILVSIVVIGFLSLSIPLGHYGTGIKIAILVSEPVKWAIAVAGLILSLRSGNAGQFFIASCYALYLLFGSLCLLIGNMLPLTPLVYELWQHSMMGLMVIILGITIATLWSSKQNEQRLKEQQLELQSQREATFIQRQFVGMVSHELRTPLALVNTIASNLKADPPLTQEELNVEANKIIQASRRLTQLTDNCLVDARLSDPFSVIDTHSVSLMKLIREAADLVSFSTNHRLLLTVVDHGTAEPVSDLKDVTLRTDSAMLRIALSNVIDNAVKYSPPGLIKVRVIVTESQVRIDIENEGTVIPAEYAQQIFDRYFKGTVADGLPASKGTGLGLFAARQIVRRLGGELILADRCDCCLFVFTLPRCENSRLASNGDHIHVADDSPG